ncbi:hypothetical protein CTAYLR_001978 [Chrysophaeum taylorii]|uniref:glucan endo-1,3-beta-D-glucosidase n=1 Tax=Chrysophaeum taylorii TaxID=2483200 RepID=A0AAD7XI53_9STRA|nr:hypothetical protein CTAYLR_001978 [Chrysophaeum taylorii]
MSSGLVGDRGSSSRSLGERVSSLRSLGERDELLSQTSTMSLGNGSFISVGGKYHHHRRRRSPTQRRLLKVVAAVFVCGVVLALMFKNAMESKVGELGPWAVRGFSTAGPHFKSPSALWEAGAQAPFPTGSWWLNAVIDKGTGAVPATPYQILCDSRGVLISYSVRRRVASRDAQVDEFGIDWLATTMTVGSSAADVAAEVARRVDEQQRAAGDYVAAADAIAATADGGVSHSGRRLSSRSHLGAVMRYDTGLSVAMVKGSPAVTLELDDDAAVSSALVLAPGADSGGRVRNATRVSPVAWVVTLSDDSRWVVVVGGSEFSDETTTISSSSSLVAVDEAVVVRGASFARVAAVPTNASIDGFVSRCPTTYARGGDVRIVDKATYALEWDVRRDPSCPDFSGLALAHHLDLKTAKKNGERVASGFESAKGPMYWMSGDAWTFREDLPDVSFHHRGYAVTDVARRKIISAQAKRDALSLKAHATRQAKEGSYGAVYFEGKELARLARLALVCMHVEAECADLALRFLEKRYERVISRAELFGLDSSWGGIVALEGYKGDPFANFGNALYSDHHFHYGYYAYAGAVLCKYRPFWGRRWARRIRELVLDFANPFDDGAVKFRDPRFPVARHKDWYDSHSWATGVVTYATGKSQESSSEAVHAYHAVALLGDALRDPALRDWGRLLMATEIRGAQRYWHMHPDEGIYSEVFAANRMAGSVSGAAVSAATWFGSNPEFVTGIQVLPVLTGLTDYLFKPNFVCEQLPVLERALGRRTPQVAEAWRGVILAEVAVAEPKQAWDEACLLDQNLFDDGNSKANLLHWIASRFADNSTSSCDGDFDLHDQNDQDYDDLPSDITGVDPSCAANLACVAFGLEGFCCPQNDGYVFGCCPVLKSP